jgi:hypothetical protein
VKGLGKQEKMCIGKGFGKQEKMLNVSQIEYVSVTFKSE